FRLDGSAREYPTVENIDDFVDRLVKPGLVVADTRPDTPSINADGDVTQRTQQRRFLRTTGMNRSTSRQIGRARQATRLLRAGLDIQQVVLDAGYLDQAHLTRSLKYFIGLTPAQIGRGGEQLSFLYNPDG